MPKSGARTGVEVESVRHLHPKTERVSGSVNSFKQKMGVEQSRVKGVVEAIDEKSINLMNSEAVAHHEAVSEGASAAIAARGEAKKRVVELQEKLDVEGDILDALTEATSAFAKAQEEILGNICVRIEEMSAKSTEMADAELPSSHYERLPVSFGKHAGKTVGFIHHNDEGYEKWVLGHRNPTGQLRKLKMWLQDSGEALSRGLVKFLEQAANPNFFDDQNKEK